MTKVAKRSIGKQKTKAKKETLFQLKITLMDAPVPIWRRVIVRADSSLAVVHDVFQIVMGWWSYHVYAFQANEKLFGNPETAEDEAKMEDANKHLLSDIMSAAGDSFLYLYDVGDEWLHHVVLEEVLHSDKAVLAFCAAGKRACPPEDVGGVDGYSRFIDAIEDPQCEERIEMLEWSGGDFDPDSFDIRGVNLRLILLEEALQLTSN